MRKKSMESSEKVSEFPQKKFTAKCHYGLFSNNCYLEVHEDHYHGILRVKDNINLFTVYPDNHYFIVLEVPKQELKRFSIISYICFITPELKNMSSLHLNTNQSSDSSEIPEDIKKVMNALMSTLVKKESDSENSDHDADSSEDSDASNDKLEAYRLLEDSDYTDTDSDLDIRGPSGSDEEKDERDCSDKEERDLLHRIFK